MVTVKGQPREYLVEPQAFGGGQVELLPQPDPDGHHIASAAAIQAGVAHTVDRLMHQQGHTRRTLARSTGIPQERLGRLLRGERWMTLPDLVALGAELEHDLIQFAYPAHPTTAKTADALVWMAPPEVTFLGSPQP